VLGAAGGLGVLARGMVNAGRRLRRAGISTMIPSNDVFSI
jgi:hypothetical protein